MPADPNSPAAQAALRSAGWTPQMYQQYLAQQAPAAGGDADYDALIQQLMGGGAEKVFSKSDLPYGYSFDQSTGMYYKQQNGKLVPADVAEVMAAAQTQSAMGRTGPSPQYTVDERTGQVVQMTPGAQVGFAGIDPREKYQNDLSQRGFENQFQLRAQALNELQNAQANLLKQADMAENAKMSRASLGENARQADLRAAMDQYQTAMNLIPQLGQLSLQESKRVQDILANGGDFLARAFESRGGKSPLAKVTQADQINAMGAALQNLRNMASSMQPNAVPRGADIPAYEAPNLSAAPSGGAVGGGFAPMPAAPTFSVSPAPAATSVAPAAGGSSGFGGGPFSSTPEPAYQPNMTPPTFDVNAPGIFPEAPKQAFDWGNPDEALAAPRGGFDVPTDLERANGANYLGGFANTLRNFWQSAITPASEQRPIGGYESGGYTHEPVFLGNEKGAELFINPTNAPIAVVPADQTKKAGFKPENTKGYDEGTASWGGKGQTIYPQPTGGFMNSLREALGNDPYEGMRRFNQDVTSDPAMMAMSLFGGAKGPRIIDPKLAAAALKEMRLAEIARRIAQNERGGGDPTAFLRSQFPERQIFDKLQMHLRELDEYGSRPDLVPTIRANIDYYRNQLPERMRSLADEMINTENQNFNYRNGQRLTQDIPGFATGTLGAAPGFGSSYYNQYAPGNTNLNNANYSGNDPTFGTASYNGDRPGGRVETQAQYQNRLTDVAARNGYQITRWDSNTPVYSAIQGQVGYQPVTQKSLIELARENLPPAAADVLAGKQARPMTALESQAVPGQFLKTITSRQLQGLTPEEIQALGTMTNTEYNAPLSFVLGRTQAQYGPSQQLQRGFLRGSL